MKDLRSKEGIKTFQRVEKELTKECPHPSICMIYQGLCGMEYMYNIKRKRRKRKGLVNKPKFFYKRSL